MGTCLTQGAGAGARDALADATAEARRRVVALAVD